MVPKRIAPTITSSATNTFAAQKNNAGTQVATAVAFNRPHRIGIGEVTITVGSAVLVAGDATNILSNSTTSAYIRGDARL